MAGMPTDSFESLTEAQRESLADFLTARNEYIAVSMKCNEMRIKVLRNPTETAKQELNDYSSLVVSPAKRTMSEKQGKLAISAFDLVGLQSMAPMLLMGVMQHVNLGMILNLVDLEPDQVQEFITMVRGYLASET